MKIQYKSESDDLIRLTQNEISSYFHNLNAVTTRSQCGKVFEFLPGRMNSVNKHFQLQCGYGWGKKHHHMPLLAAMRVLFDRHVDIIPAILNFSLQFLIKTYKHQVKHSIFWVTLSLTLSLSFCPPL